MVMTGGCRALLCWRKVVCIQDAQAFCWDMAEQAPFAFLTLLPGVWSRPECHQPIIPQTAIFFFARYTHQAHRGHLVFKPRLSRSAPGFWYRFKVQKIIDPPGVRCHRPSPALCCLLYLKHIGESLPSSHACSFRCEAAAFFFFGLPLGLAMQTKPVTKMLTSGTSSVGSVTIFSTLRLLSALMSPYRRCMSTRTWNLGTSRATKISPCLLDHRW